MGNEDKSMYLSNDNITTALQIMLQIESLQMPYYGIHTFSSVDFETCNFTI